MSCRKSYLLRNQLQQMLAVNLAAHPGHAAICTAAECLMDLVVLRTVSASRHTHPVMLGKVVYWATAAEVLAEPSAVEGLPSVSASPSMGALGSSSSFPGLSMATLTAISRPSISLPFMSEQAFCWSSSDSRVTKPKPRPLRGSLRAWSLRTMKRGMGRRAILAEVGLYSAKISRS